MSIDYSTIYRNVLKFISTRGFEIDIAIEEDINRSFQFREYIKISAKKNDESLYVILTSVDNSVVSKLIEFKKIINSIKDKNPIIIFISEKGIKSSVDKHVKLLKRTKNIKIQNLLYSHFKVDPRDNVLVPKHILCTEEEKRIVMEDNSIEDEMLFPVIRQNDPQVIWLGGEPGQLVKIIRRDVTGEVLYYRIIV